MKISKQEYFKYLHPNKYGVPGYTEEDVELSFKMRDYIFKCPVCDNIALSGNICCMCGHDSCGDTTNEIEAEKVIYEQKIAEDPYYIWDVEVGL